MARYLVIHSPREAQEQALEPPTRMEDLARDVGSEDASPRWLTAWSPDLRDDRIVTLWEADSADDILHTLGQYGFLSHMEADPLRVQEWGPTDVLAAHTGQ